MSIVPPAIDREQRELIAAAYDPTTTRRVGQRVVDLLTDHLQILHEASGPVLNWREPEANIAIARDQLAAGDDQSIESQSALLERVEGLITQTLARGQNLHHPHYVGHQVPASLPMAGLFDAVTTVTNQVMAIYEMGPWATAVERAVVECLGAEIGFASGSFTGLVTSGGSLANLTALLTARNTILGNSWSKGISSRRTSPVLVAHAEAHYCVTRSAGILGLGTDNIVKVPLDAQRRMDPNQLDTILANLRRNNTPIVAVSAAACATPTGAFDPLSEIADVCRRHEVWLHVDAAHGGAACLSDRYAPLVDGLQLADSVVCDAHKMMFMPALCALVFYRNSDHRYAAFQQSAPYLFDPSAPGMTTYDNGISNLECTKRAAAMGLWSVWSVFGKRLFEALVDTTFDLGREFYELLVEADDFEPFCAPQCNIVVFRYLPAQLRDASMAEIDTFQLRLRRAVIESGEFYLVQTSLDGRSYLRTTLINPLTTIDQLRMLLDCLREQGAKLLSSI
ncbi:MAG: aminotransferase class V-fold PLP-dependent enzyme [Planctomycetota bacterium]